MSKKLALGLLLALAALWVLALVHTGPGRGPARERQTGALPHGAAPPADAHAAIGDAQEKRPQEVARTAPPPAAATDDRREQLVRLAAELRARNESRYTRAVARFPHEPRREPWATAREKELRGALLQDGLEGLVSEVECRASLCRIELSAQDSDAAFAVQRARSLRRTAGPQVAVGMSGSGPDRIGILFIARPERPLDP